MKGSGNGLRRQGGFNKGPRYRPLFEGLGNGHMDAAMICVYKGQKDQAYKGCKRKNTLIGTYIAYNDIINLETFHRTHLTILSGAKGKSKIIQ
jgi:hypothetical protein